MKSFMSDVFTLKIIDKIIIYLFYYKFILFKCINNNKTLTVKEKLILKKEKEFKISENEKKKEIYKELLNQFKENDKKKIFEIMNMSEIQIKLK